MTLYVVLNAFLMNYYFGHSLRQVIVEKYVVKEKHKLKNTKSYPITVPCSHLKVAFFYTYRYQENILPYSFLIPLPPFSLLTPFTKYEQLAVLILLTIIYIFKVKVDCISYA